MAKLDSIKKAKRTGKAARPFGEPHASDNGRFEILIPEGAASGIIPNSDQYIGKLTHIIENVSKKGQGNPQLVFTFQLVSPKQYRGMAFDLHCPKIPNSMWKLTDTLTALGFAVTPGKKQEVDRDKLKGTLVRLNIKEQPASDGFRAQSKIQNVLPHPDGAGKKSKNTGTFVPPSDEEEEMEDEGLEEQDEVEEQDEEDEDEETIDDEEDEDAEEDEGDEDEDEAEGDENEEDEWNVAKEREAFTKKAGRPRLKKDPEYADVTPKRRGGPAVVETPVKRGPGRPPKKARR
jgi:hypothetical protein